jgi:hypothetical protein
MEVNLTLNLEEVNLVLQTLDRTLQSTPEFSLIQKIKSQGEPQLAAQIENLPKDGNEENNPEPV